MISALKILLLISTFILCEFILRFKDSIKHYQVSDSVIEDAYEKINFIDKLLKRVETGPFAYRRISNYLKKRGNPVNLSPGSYFICKVLSAIAGFWFTYSFWRNFCILGGIFGYFWINIYYYRSDKEAMNHIKLELPDVCDSIVLQMHAGSFLVRALTDCNLIARNKRLKEALSIMASKINLNSDILGALQDFKSRFKSADIDSFVLTIEQSLTTGKLETALSDFSKSQKESSSAQRQANNAKIKGTQTLIEFLLFTGIMALCLFAMFSSLKMGNQFSLN